jgi:hypothetical protein
VKQQKRATANQFDQALLEQIESVSHMNVPHNALASAVTFCNLVGDRLYGERLFEKRSEAFKAVFQRVIKDAQVERAEFEMKMKEAARQAQEQQPRIIMPGMRNPTKN